MEQHEILIRGTKYVKYRIVAKSLVEAEAIAIQDARNHFAVASIVDVVDAEYTPIQNDLTVV